MKTVKEIYDDLEKNTFYKTNPCPIYASYPELRCIEDCPFAIDNLECFLYNTIGNFSSREICIKTIVKLFPSLLLEEENK